MRFRLTPNLVLAFSAAISASSLLWAIGPWLETTYWPVFSKFRLVSEQPVGLDKTEVVFEFDKLRNCLPAGYAWFDGDLGAFRSVDVNVIASEHPARPAGAGQKTSPYIIDVPADHVSKSLSGEIYSHCPLIPWRTTSRVWP